MKIKSPNGKELEVSEKAWNVIYSQLDGYEKVETKAKKAEGKNPEGSGQKEGGAQ